MEQLSGTAAFVVVNLANLAISAAALELFPERRQWQERILIITAVFLLSATAMVTLLGMAGLLNRRNLLVLAGLLGILATLFLYRRPVAEAPAKEPQGHFARAAYSILGGVTAVWFVQAFFQGIQYRGDDLSYHGLNLSRWFLDQSFAVQAPAVQAYYPANSTAMALWFSIPFGSDAYAGVTGFVYGLLLALGVLTLLRRAGVQASAAALVAAALLWSHQLQSAGFSLTATDLAGPALILAGLVFTIPEAESSRSLTINTVAVGMLGGSAIGVKPSFAVPAAILFLILILRNLRTCGFRFAASRAALLAGAGTLTGGYWYLRNWWLTGNPVFPMETLFFEGGYGREAVRESTMAFLIAEKGSLALLSTALQIASDWPRTLWILALVGYIAALLILLRARGGRSGRSAEVAVRLLAIGAAWLIAYPLFPFSGGNATTFAAGTVHPHIARFLILPFACGITLAGLIDWRRLAVGFAAGALLAEELFSDRQVLSSLALMAPVAAFLFWALKMSCHLGKARSQRPGMARAILQPLCLLALLVLPGILEPHKLQENRRRLGAEHGLEGLLNIVDSWYRPRTSGILRINYCYPLFGNRFQNDVRWVQRDGRRLPPMHEAFLARSPAHDLPPEIPSENHFLEHLRSARVEYLLLIEPQASSVQTRLLASSEDVELAWKSGDKALWRLRRPVSATDRLTLIRSEDGQGYLRSGRREPIPLGDANLRGGVTGALESRGDYAWLSGWAVDTLGPTLTESVAVFRNGEFVQSAPNRLENLEVTRRFNNPDLARSGFHFGLLLDPAGAAASEIRVFAVSGRGTAAELDYPALEASYLWPFHRSDAKYALTGNSGTGTDRIVTAAGKAHEIRRDAVTGQVFAELDDSTALLYGWAAGPGGSGSVGSVAAFADGEFVGAVPALLEVQRTPNLSETAPSDAGFRLSFSLPRQTAGETVVRVFAFSREGTAGELSYPPGGLPEAWPFPRSRTHRLERRNGEEELMSSDGSSVRVRSRGSEDLEGWVSARFDTELECYRVRGWIRQRNRPIHSVVLFQDGMFLAETTPLMIARPEPDESPNPISERPAFFFFPEVSQDMAASTSLRVFAISAAGFAAELNYPSLASEESWPFLRAPKHYELRKNEAGQELLVGTDGAVHEVTRDQVLGWTVGALNPGGQTAWVGGWVVDPTVPDLVSVVLVYVNGKLVAGGPSSLEHRQTMERFKNPGVLRSGFRIAFRMDEEAAPVSQVRVFAITKSGRAGELNYPGPSAVARWWPFQHNG